MMVWNSALRKCFLLCLLLIFGTFSQRGSAASSTSSSTPAPRLGGPRQNPASGSFFPPALRWGSATSTLRSAPAVVGAPRKVINISLFPKPPRPYSIRRITGKLSGFLLNIPSVRKGIIDATFKWSVRKVHKELCVFFLGQGVGLQIVEFMRDLLLGVGGGGSAALSAGPLVGALWLVGISVRVWFLGSMLRIAWCTSFRRRVGGGATMGSGGGRGGGS